MTDFKEFPWYIDPPLKKKLDLMIECLKTDDAWVVIDGDEGAGKSTMAAFIMYYVHCKTGRPLSADNFFFDAEEMFTVTKNNSGMLLNWDEAALGGLSRQWQNKNQQNLMQLGMTGRIKHHFIVLCIPKADKLGEYFVRDRTLGLIHVYKRKGIKKGRYLYFDKKKKERFWEDYRRSRRRRYPALKSFRGSFPNCFSKIIDEELYETKKLDAISKIGNVKEKKMVLVEQVKQKRNNLIYNLRMSGMSLEDLAKANDCTVRRIQMIIKEEKERRNIQVVYSGTRNLKDIVITRVSDKKLIEPFPAQ
jgi:hypothetical protein